MDVRPYTVSVPQAVLDDLRERLARARWPDEVEDAGWDYVWSVPPWGAVSPARTTCPRRFTSSPGCSWWGRWGST